ALKSALSDVANQRRQGIHSGEFKGLVVDIVRKKAASLFRREMAEGRSPFREETPGNELASPPSHVQTPEEEAIANESMTQLTDLILSGPDDTDRAIAYLKFFEDYSTQQICDWLREHGKKALK